MKGYLSICFFALFATSMSAQVTERMTEKAEKVQIAEEGIISEKVEIAEKAEIVGKSENADNAEKDQKGEVKNSVSTQQTPMGALYGFCNRRAIIEAQPEYAVVVEQMETLKKQYEGEIEYNEADFRRQFQEYLYGQKEFPQTILLKRQRDLQLAMEKGIAFRTEVDSLLRQARTDLLRPIEAHVDAAINAVAAERGYDYVVDTENGAFLYLNPRLSEDITLYVEEKLR